VTPKLGFSVDLGLLLQKLESSAELSQEVRQRAQETRARLGDAVIAAYASSRMFPGAGENRPAFGGSGLAIYFPNGKREFQRDPFGYGYRKGNLNRPVAFVREHSWADLLAKLLDL
jgi:hypothetical protein